MSGWWWLEHDFYIFHILGISSSQLTNKSIFQRGWNQPPTRDIYEGKTCGNICGSLKNVADFWGFSLLKQEYGEKWCFQTQKASPETRIFVTTPWICATKDEPWTSWHGGLSYLEVRNDATNQLDQFSHTCWSSNRSMKYGGRSQTWIRVRIQQRISQNTLRQKKMEWYVVWESINNPPIGQK